MKQGQSVGMKCTCEGSYVPMCIYTYSSIIFNMVTSYITVSVHSDGRLHGYRD